MPIADRTSPALRTARSRDQPAIISGIAAFSAAVKAGRWLNCWNTNPIIRARKHVRARSLIAVNDWSIQLILPSAHEKTPPGRRIDRTVGAVVAVAITSLEQ
jgi:hypothetical protein